MSVFSSNTPHSALVAQLNAFDRKKEHHNLFSLRRFWVNTMFYIFAAAVPLNIINLSSDLIQLKFTPWTIASGALSLALFFVVGAHWRRWKDHLKTLQHPNMAAVERHELRETLLTMHTYDETVLPTLQKIEQRIDQEDIVWLRSVHNTSKQYWREVMVQNYVDPEKYNCIRAHNSNKHLKL